MLIEELIYFQVTIQVFSSEKDKKNDHYCQFIYFIIFFVLMFSYMFLYICTLKKIYDCLCLLIATLICIRLYNFFIEFTGTQVILKNLLSMGHLSQKESQLNLLCIKFVLNCYFQQKLVSQV